MRNPSNNCVQQILVRLVSSIGLLGFFAIVLPALSQQQQMKPANSNFIDSIRSPNRINSHSSNFDGRVRGGNRDYPYGSKVFDNGRISTPNQGSVYPSSTIRHGNGTTSYYYRDGSRITVDPTKVSPSGTPIRK